MSPGIVRHIALQLALVGVVLTLVGCQPSVRENRTITFSSDGRVAFQHGNNGVFVTDPTGKPKQVYQATSDDFATSLPLWDPSGKRMVFTVAQLQEGKLTRPQLDTPADGRRYAAVPVRYTCWLYDPSTGNEPEKLFEAKCRHAGYIAAGLAVSWHPSGQRLDYVDEAPQQKPQQPLGIVRVRHHLRTFDLTSRQTESGSLPSAENIVIGASTDGRHRCAVLGSSESTSGVWVEDVANNSWWLVTGCSPKLLNLEEARRMLPKWSRDGSKFAFVYGTDLRVCNTATRQTETWFHLADQQSSIFVRTPDVSEGLFWHPDGTRVGLIDRAHLGLVDSTGEWREVTHSLTVSFAGWDSTGSRMAYVTAEPLPYSADPRLPALFAARNATLFIPNDAARTTIWFASADGTKAKQVMSGVRATFPHWSQNEPRLSVWLTVEPTYRLVPDGALGMRAGDPAALIDADTGKLDWLPVNGTEHAQIGIVELLGGRVDAALRKFDEAAAKLPAGEKADWMFFRAIALQKAGRAAEAREAWQRFEPPTRTPAQEKNTRALTSLGRALDPRVPPETHGVIRARHRFIAEGFGYWKWPMRGSRSFARKSVKQRQTRNDSRPCLYWSNCYS
jgi:Tol biopolymer transport system component